MPKAPRKRGPRKKLLPEDYLERAMAAKSPRARGTWARRGLAAAAELDRTTQAMLLHQLYLSHFSLGQFEQAHEVAKQATELDVLADVMHQDAARARQALGDVDGAVGHLRLAAQLRRRIGAEHTHALLETTLLRRRAAAKFSRAGEMYFTRTALEQASAEPVSVYRAQRYAAAGFEGFDGVERQGGGLRQRFLGDVLAQPQGLETTAQLRFDAFI